MIRLYLPPEKENKAPTGMRGSEGLPAILDKGGEEKNPYFSKDAPHMSLNGKQSKEVGWVSGG
jgi:hypothetical protein